MNRMSGPASSEPGERVTGTVEKIAAVSPAPSPSGAETHTGTGRRAFTLGTMVLGLVMLGALGFIVYAPPDHAPASRLRGSTLEEPSTPSQANFDVLLANGWTRYVVGEVGFSIEVPPGWRPLFGSRPDPEDHAAWDLSGFAGLWSSGSIKRPVVFVSTLPIQDWETSRAAFDRYWHRAANYQGVLRQSELSRTQLPHGTAYAFTEIQRSEVGRLVGTTYLLHRGKSGYTLITVGPMALMERFEDVLADIVESFDVTP